MWQSSNSKASSRALLVSSAKAAREAREKERKKLAAVVVLQRFLRGRLASWKLTKERLKKFDSQSSDIRTLLEMKIPLPLLAVLPTIRLGMSLMSRSLTIPPELKPRLLQIIALWNMILNRDNVGVLHPLCLQAREFTHALDKLVTLVLYKLQVWHNRCPSAWTDREPLVEFLLRLAFVLEKPVCNGDICVYPQVRKNLFRRIQKSELYKIAGEQIMVVVCSHDRPNDISDTNQAIRASAEAAYAAKLFELCMHKLLYKHQSESETCYRSYMSMVSNILVKVPDMVTRMGSYITPILQTTYLRIAVNWKIVGTILRELHEKTAKHPLSTHVDIAHIATTTGFEPQVYRDLIEDQNIIFSEKEALVGAVNCYSMAIQSEYIHSVDEDETLTAYGSPSDVLRLVKSFCGRAWCYAEDERYRLAFDDIERALILLRHLDEHIGGLSVKPSKDQQKLQLDCYMVRARVAEELGYIQTAVDDYSMVVKLGSKLLPLSTWKRMKECHTELSYNLKSTTRASNRHKQASETSEEIPVDDKPSQEPSAQESTCQDGETNETKKRKKKKKKSAGGQQPIPVQNTRVATVDYTNKVTVKSVPFKTVEELQKEHQRITREIFQKESIEIAERVRAIQFASSTADEVSTTTTSPPDNSIAKKIDERQPTDSAPLPPSPPSFANSIPPKPKPLNPPLPKESSPPLPRSPPSLPLAPPPSSPAPHVFERPHQEPQLERKMSAEVKSNQVLEFILDGANIGFCHGRNIGQQKLKKRHFSAKGISLALQYFNRSGSKPRAIAFLPQRFVESRYEDNLADDIALLQKLMEENVLFLTPAGVDDDLFMLKYAEKHNLGIVTNDNLADHIEDAKLKLAMTPLVFTRAVKYMFIEDEFLSLQ